MFNFVKPMTGPITIIWYNWLTTNWLLQPNLVKYLLGDMYGR